MDEGGFGVQFQEWLREFFSFSKSSRPALGPTNLLLNENRDCFTRDAVAGV